MTHEIPVEYDARPLHETYVVPTTIKPDDGLHLFVYVGHFLAYIAPHNLTIGKPFRHRPRENLRWCVCLCVSVSNKFVYSAVNCMLEMLKDVFQSKVTLVQLVLEVFSIERKCQSNFMLRPQADKTIGQNAHLHTFSVFLQAMKMETGLICLVMIILFISLMPLCTISIWACLNESGDDYAERTLNGNDERRIDSIVAFEETIDRTMHCRRVFQFFLQFFSVILM